MDFVHQFEVSPHVEAPSFRSLVSEPPQA